jgi:hypothetical protein
MIEFKSYGRKDVIMNDKERREIVKFFKNMQIKDSYEIMIQKCYNHNMHYTTTPKEYDLCTEDALSEIISKANSEDPNDKLIVFGKKHTNFHFSYSFYDRMSHQWGAETQDTYISVKLPNSNRYYHILIMPPETRHPYLNYIFNTSYPIPEYIVPPIPTLH